MSDKAYLGEGFGEGAGQREVIAVLEPPLQENTGGGSGLLRLPSQNVDFGVTAIVSWSLIPVVCPI